MTPTSTLQLACPTCGDDIGIEYEISDDGDVIVVDNMRTWRFHALSREQAHDLLMDDGARQAELAMDRAGERD